VSWLIKFGGVELDSDDFTIEELGEVEKVSGVPWSLANPLREISVAKAFLAVVLLRTGTSERDLMKELEALTLGKIKRSFEWVDDGSDQEGEEEPDPSDQPPSQTSPPSSPGEPGKAGSQAT
jgi:hypothetical protein